MPSVPGVSQAPAGRAWMFRHGIPTPAEETEFQLGFISDLPPHMIPAGGAVEISDFLTDLPGKLYKRGGTIAGSDPIGSGVGGLVAIAFCPFLTGDRMFGIGDAGSGVKKLFDITRLGSTYLADINRQPKENPTFVQADQTDNPSFLCVTEGYAASVVPKKVFQDGTVSDLSTSAPDARYSCMIGGTLALANSDDHPNRIWFSNPINPTDFAPGGVALNANLIDTQDAITGLASIDGALLAFHRGSVDRILPDALGWPAWIGSVDGNPVAGNPTIQTTAMPGCIDA